MHSTLLQLLLLWLVGIPAAVVFVASAYPPWVRSRIMRARRRAERH